ncbi:MAG: arylformamidase [Shewanella sp.]|jgi:arylformamidase
MLPPFDKASFEKGSLGKETLEQASLEKKHLEQALLEQQYSPSSCVDDIMIYIQQYIDQSQIVIQQAVAENSVLRDLKYGDLHCNLQCKNKREDEVLDLFLPAHHSAKGQAAATAQGKKLHVFIHGGYWQELTKEESAFAASAFQQAGHYFAVINYSLAPKASLTEIVEQNRRALAWLAANADELGFDANEIYLSGSSAGAHLCLMMLQTDWPIYLTKCYLAKKHLQNSCLPSTDQANQPNINTTLNAEQPFIKGVCAVSGIYDIAPLLKTTINDPLQLTPVEVEANSPLRHLTLNHCPVIIVFGDNETSEFKRQSLAMKAQLEEQGFTVTFSEIAGRNHFDVILDLGIEGAWLFEEVLKQMD